MCIISKFKIRKLKLPWNICEHVEHLFTETSSMSSCSAIGCTNRSKINKKVLFHRVPSEKRNKLFCPKMIQSTK